MLTNGNSSINKDAKIELLHIQLEIQNNRGQHLRHFIDQYYCYQNGLITKGGVAAWERIVWKGVVSHEARKTNDRDDVVKDHVIPLNFISAKLRSLSDAEKTSLEKIKEILEKYIIFGTITKAEDERLNEKGLRSKMPEGFSQPGHELFENLFARYKAVNITYDDNRA